MPSYSFSKNRRLLKASEYQEVFDRNKLKVAHPKLLLLAKQSDCDQSRLGLVVGKKNIPTAVMNLSFIRGQKPEPMRRGFIKPCLPR